MAISLWSPFYIHDHIQIKVQKRATGLVTTVSDLLIFCLRWTFHPWLKDIEEEIWFFQMMHGHVDINVSNLFTPASYTATRGHNYKIFRLQSSCLPQSRLLLLHQLMIATLCLIILSIQRVTGIQGKQEWEWKTGMETCKIVVLHRILYQWCPQNCVNLATSTQSSFYHTISTDPHKTVYRLMPFMICYNYTILSAYLTLTTRIC